MEVTKPTGYGEPGAAGPGTRNGDGAPRGPAPTTSKADRTGTQVILHPAKHRAPGAGYGAGRTLSERPLLVALLPMMLALLTVLVLLLAVRIWILARMLETSQDLVERRRTVAAQRVTGPAPRPQTALMPPPPPGVVRTVERKTWVVIHTSPPEVETFVYVGGGTLLGKAPVRTAALRPGTHRLLFWAPSIRGRATRTIYVQPDATTWVSQEVRPAEQF